MLNSAKLNLAFLIMGAALQAVSMFDVDAVKPYSSGILFFAGVLLTLGRWDKIKIPAKSVAILLALALPLSSCAWLQRRGGDVVDCGLEAAKSADVRGAVLRVLQNPNAVQVGLELGKLAGEFSYETIDCIVQRIVSDTLGAAPGDDIVKANGRAWLDR